MNSIKIYQVDTFTDKVFTGNSAAVCILEKWLNDDIMQNIASENNLSETAFVVKEGSDFHIRWFTPIVEVDLCGHATLASAYVIANFHEKGNEFFNFKSRSGKLSVSKHGDLYTLDFPSDNIVAVNPDKNLLEGFNHSPHKIFKGISDYLLIFNTQEEIESLQPDFRTLEKIDARGIIVTAKGDYVDFVSRFFAPRYGINEDPVTGSSFTTLAPYWSKELGKNELEAVQISQRKGFVKCNFKGKRVDILGKACLYMAGEIYI